jgi:hypothetical protein
MATQNEEGFISGGVAGAGTGAAIGAAFAPATAGGSIAAGALIGFAIGGLAGNMQSDRARRAQVDAEKAAETARRRAIMKEFGARQQAEAIALSSTKGRSTGGGQGSQPAGGAALSQEGTIGANVQQSGSQGISGTF